MACPSCGFEDYNPASACPRCRKPVSGTTGPADRPGVAGLIPAAWLTQVPPELLAVCALMAVAGLLLLWPALQILPPSFQVLGLGGLATALGLLALELGIVILALGVSLLILAVRLTRADRVARGLSYILLGAFSLAVLFGNDHYIGLVIVMLLCLACLAILAGVPRVRMFFTGPEAPHAGEGVSVTVARTLLAAFACLCILLGVAFIPAGDLGGQWVLAGIMLIAIGVTVFVLNSHLARGEPAARLITTGLLVVYAILELITSGRDPASLLPLAMAAGIAGLLWLPPDAQQHFSQPRTAAGM